MRKIALVLTSFLLAFPALAGADPDWLGSLAAARAKAAKSNTYLLVDLYAEWCGWCKKLERDVFAKPEFKSAAAGFVLLRVDVEDHAEGSELQQRFDAYSLPTTLILTSDLIRVGKIEGYLPVKSFTAAIEREVAGFKLLLSRFDEKRTTSDHRTLAEFARDLYERGDGKRASFAFARLLELGKAQGREAALLRYKLADSLRLAGDFTKATTEAGEAHRLAASAKDQDLAEAAELLVAKISQDNGECKKAIAAIQTFLQQHPASGHEEYARYTLRALQTAHTCS